jgi:ketosteroid isomerase-like protein
MTPEEKEVYAAMERFYEALDRMSDGEGATAMREAWHHTSRVTATHPTGEWLIGWDQVEAAWNLAASFGRKGNGGSRIRDVRVHVYGDIAYTTAVFIAAPSFNRVELNCTNILHKVDGVWKIIHHHPDRIPDFAETVEKLCDL